MSKIIGKIRFYCIAILLFPASAVYGEVYPTGKQQQLFKEQSFQTPTNWQIRTLPTGQKFLMSTYYGAFSATIQTKDGPMPFSHIPWAREAIVRIGYDQLKDPAIFKDLLENKTNPLMFFGYGGYHEPYVYPGRTPAEIEDYFNFVLKAKQAFGPRFLCLDYCEWSHGGVSDTQPIRNFKETLKLFNISCPTNCDEAAAWWNMTYDVAFKRYQDAGIPILSWNCSSLNHYEARKGSSYTGNEIAYGNPANDSTFIAFCRGAARQFNIPWGVYAAEYGKYGHCIQNRRYRPDERHGQGPCSGPPLLQTKRTLYAAYMAGANFLQRESDPETGMLADYDPLTVDRTDPRIIALQDKTGKKYAGPYALLCGDFYDNIVKKHDRGAPWTPIALMFDKNHGFAFYYSTTLALGAIPYTIADEQMRAAINTIFPCGGGFGASYAAGPFGEIFDVLTTEAPAPVINTYRAIVLVGQARVDTQAAAVLKQFVANGGLLFMACEQMTPELWRLAGISDTGQTGKDSAYVRASDFYSYNQGGFEYHKVKLDGAEPLFVANKYEDRIWSVATINRVGKGAVVVGTPVWLNVKGNPTKMHGLFSEVMTMIADELVPVRIYGGEIKVMFNRNETGWVVTLMNNQGLTAASPGYKPAAREYNAAGVVLKPRFGYSTATEWLTGQKLAVSAGDASVSVIVPPGEIRIVEFRIK